jgi:hypothetical protein
LFAQSEAQIFFGNVIGQRKNSPGKSWISSYFFTVRAKKFACWKMGLIGRYGYNLTLLGLMLTFHPTSKSKSVLLID